MRLSITPAPHPKEFRDDVVAVASRGELPLSQVAKDSGISESGLRNWLELLMSTTATGRADSAGVGGTARAEAPQ